MSRELVWSVCLRCGSAYQAHIRPSRDSRQKYCSKPCRIAANSRTLAERFWEKVDKNGPIPPNRSALGQCWLWVGARMRHTGYGQLSMDGRVTVATRVAVTLDGRPPGKLFVCHHCDNPPCVRPSHLFLGTRGDNMRDAVSKGRMCRGERWYRSRMVVRDPEYRVAS